MANRGFIHWKGHFASYATKGSSFTQLLGINNKGLAVGFYTIGTTTYGFELDRKTGRPHPLGPHAGVGITPTSINNNADYCGFYTSGGKTIGFMTVGKKYTGIHYPAATTTQPFGINDKLDVVGDYVDKAGKMHGFLVQTPTTHPVWTSFDDPNGVGTTTINGLNDRLDMVGFYVDSKGNTHGMLITRP